MGENSEYVVWCEVKEEIGTDSGEACHSGL